MNANQDKYPQLRFNGFTDPWEQRKLGEISKTTIGEFVIKNKQDSDAPYPVYNGGISYTGFYDEFNNEGDKIVISARGANAGFVNYIDGRFWAGNSCYSVDILDKKKFSVEFMYQFLKRNQHLFTDYQQAANIPSVSKKGVATFIVQFPTQNEQREIASFFKQLDNLITLHQRKLAKLKELKQGYLQKLFPKNGSKFPQLRFAGFADAWEQRKLSDLTERVTRKNKNNESSRPLTISAQDGLIDQNDFFDKQIASRDVSGYFLVKNGEFAYNKSYSNGYPWGVIKRLDKYDMGVLSTLYIIFRPTNISSQFLVSYYDTTKWYKEVAKNAAEGARNHGLLNIAPTDFFSTVLVIPNSIEEQQKIGTFFKQLDDTITLHQRKLEKLQELKKGYLQKMFC